MNDTASDPEQAFKVWKHYADTGGADKNWMIQIVTWLLGFSAGIIGFYATGKLVKAAFAVILLGILISLLAAATSLLYGAYAAWNWAIADQIAKKYNWKEQRPDYDPFEGAKVSWAVQLAGP
jgi:ABC-type dipeptide/oligopeptide/nickel transport system permease component